MTGKIRSGPIISATGNGVDSVSEIVSFEIKTNNVKYATMDLDKKVKVAFEIIGGDAETNAKHLCPVDTGNLRNSITHKVAADGMSVTIGSNVHYAPYVELGHRNARGGKKVPAQPYLRPAIEHYMEDYRETLRRILEDETT